ncbi:Os01g0843500 [Oryza sativa Japonica Group]|uniref:Os01g0843500 protein n=2 Tax=Oryza sativa TaxID=4530 RepID=A0A0P0VAC3_ORYSJ|nr:hypothetical protein OsI_04401 [Oryza sativa Indica Group]KAB8084256.1 hypothetical protein EE612_006767 [Oryza sativa]BAS75179.1 Os01g0843500 [Oryza sativa Japonica Group]
MDDDGGGVLALPVPLPQRACPPLVSSAGRPLPAQSAATKVPEDGHRLLLRCRHDRQAQRPLLHRHERVLLLQRHRRTPASSPDSPVRFASCWLYTRGHSRSVTHTLF